MLWLGCSSSGMALKSDARPPQLAQTKALGGGQAHKVSGHLGLLSQPVGAFGSRCAPVSHDILTLGCFEETLVRA